MAALAALVQGLPPELYDEILELTLTPNEDEVEITRDYKPPNQLQISSATRDRASYLYYTHTKFHYTLDEYEWSGDHIAQWMSSLAESSLVRMCSLRIERSDETAGMPYTASAITRFWDLHHAMVYSPPQFEAHLKQILCTTLYPEGKDGPPQIFTYEEVTEKALGP